MWRDYFTKSFPALYMDLLKRNLMASHIHCLSNIICGISFHSMFSTFWDDLFSPKCVCKFLFGRLWAHCLALYIMTCCSCLLLYFVRSLIGTVLFVLEIYQWIIWSPSSFIWYLLWLSLGIQEHHENEISPYHCI